MRRETLTDAVTAVGTLLANESVMIRPEIDGRIEAIHFQEGQLVRKGDKLVSLDAAEQGVRTCDKGVVDRYWGRWYTTVTNP